MKFKEEARSELSRIYTYGEGASQLLTKKFASENLRKLHSLLLVRY